MGLILVGHVDYACRRLRGSKPSSVYECNMGSVLAGTLSLVALAGNIGVRSFAAIQECKDRSTRMIQEVQTMLTFRGTCTAPSSSDFKEMSTAVSTVLNHEDSSQQL